ncbi:MAG: deoxyguanosinetriphosphate triphosphohydrolase [Eubacteriales bacterium]
MKWTELLCSERIRSYQKNNGSDLRSEFEKDYHRIIGSASFRRLQDKTQVFPLDKSDFVRTRLTHSLEVASFAKSLGQYVGAKILEQKLDSDFTIANKSDICHILECAGLLHDIGNPPFGHFGETLIRDWFRSNLSKYEFYGERLEDILDEQMKADFLNFEGNTQAFRVVTKLHYLVDENGMNLNKSLLGTIVKYPVASTAINKKSGNVKDKKMGYYYADTNSFQEVVSSLRTNGNRHPLTFLLEAADDIAYLTADIEDGVKKGCISYEYLLQQLKETFGENHSYVMDLKKKYQQAMDQNNKEARLNAIQNWLIKLQGIAIYTAGDSFIHQYREIMDGKLTTDLLAGVGDLETLMNLLRRIAFEEIFQSRTILQSEVATASIVNDLLDKFIDAILYYDTKEEQSSVQKKLVQLISQNYIRSYQIYSKEKSDIEKLYLRLLLVTDFICGMTDSYAKSLYEEINGKM